MKIKSPERVKIGSFVYNVKLEKDLSMTQGNVGEHRPHLMEIVIDDRTRSKTPVFLHECIHAICANYTINIDDDTVDRLSHGMAELFDNLNIEIEWD